MLHGFFFFFPHHTFLPKEEKENYKICSCWLPIIAYIFAGGYDKEEKAARAYDLAALKYWGTTTTTNFPVSWHLLFLFFPLFIFFMLITLN